MPSLSQTRQSVLSTDRLLGTPEPARSVRSQSARGPSAFKRGLRSSSFRLLTPSSFKMKRAILCGAQQEPKVSAASHEAQSIVPYAEKPSFGELTDAVLDAICRLHALEEARNQKTDKTDKTDEDNAMSAEDKQVYEEELEKARTELQSAKDRLEAHCQSYSTNGNDGLYEAIWAWRERDGFLATLRKSLEQHQRLKSLEGERELVRRVSDEDIMDWMRRTGKSFGSGWD